MGNPSCSPYSFIEEVGKTTVKIDGERRLFTTEASSFDFKHIFKDDHREVTAFIQLAKDSKVFLDVGASRGVYSALFKKINPYGNVHSFEGSKESCTAIKGLCIKNKIYKQIAINECMVGKQDGIGSFSLENCGYVQIVSNSTLKKVDRPLISLDSYCEKSNLTPDLLKIDVEGYELEVLQGAKQILKKYSPKILLEIHLSYLDQRSIYPKKVLDILTSLGYNLFDIDKKPTSLSSVNSSLHSTLHLIAIAS